MKNEREVDLVKQQNLLFLLYKSIESRRQLMYVRHLRQKNKQRKFFSKSVSFRKFRSHDLNEKCSHRC